MECAAGLTPEKCHCSCQSRACGSSGTISIAGAKVSGMADFRVALAPRGAGRRARQRPSYDGWSAARVRLTGTLSRPVCLRQTPVARWAGCGIRLAGPQERGRGIAALLARRRGRRMEVVALNATVLHPPYGPQECDLSSRNIHD